MSERKSSDASSTEGRSEGDTVFVVAKEAIIDVPGEPKRVGYTVNPAFPTFGAWDDAAAFVKQKNLPLGWVIVEPKQLNLSVTPSSTVIEECARVCDAEWRGTSSLCRSKAAGDLAKRIRSLKAAPRGNDARAVAAEQSAPDGTAPAAAAPVASAVAAPCRDEIIEECAKICDRAAGECENLLHEQPWSDYARACRNEAQSLAIGIRALKT